MANNQTTKYELLLASVIAARASSYLFNKIFLRTMQPFNLMAVRFLLAFVLLSVLFYKDLRQISRKTILSGLAIGGFFFLTMAFQMQALKEADSSLVSLLTSCSIIFVPLFEIVLVRKLPDRRETISVLLAMAGVAVLALQHGGLSGSFTFGLLSAAWYALAILTTARLTRDNPDTLGIGIIQVGTIGALALVASLLLEQPHLPTGEKEWGMLAVLVIVCTIFGFTLQPKAQSHVSAERAGLFCAITPAIATLLGVVVLGERLGILGILGLGLVLLSILLPYVSKFIKVIRSA